MGSHAVSELTESPAALVLPAGHATQAPPEACWFCLQILGGGEHTLLSHTRKDVQSLVVEHASLGHPDAEHDDVLEPPEYLNMSVTVALPVFQHNLCEKSECSNMR